MCTCWFLIPDISLAKNISIEWGKNWAPPDIHNLHDQLAFTSLCRCASKGIKCMHVNSMDAKNLGIGAHYGSWLNKNKRIDCRTKYTN